MSSILSTTTSDAEEERRRRAINEVVLEIMEDIFHEFNKGYKHEGTGKYVNMKEPRPCSYNKNFGYDYENGTFVKETIPIGQPIPRQNYPNGSATDINITCTPMPAELRGINLRQLRAVTANVERRCVKEKWTDYKGTNQLLTPEKVTMHEINKYITIPYTKESKASFVETLPSTAGTQPPRFFVSHTWGETFYHTMECIEQMVKDFDRNKYHDDDKKGGGMTEDTPIWICAFANNQHELGDAITAHPSELGFVKAMEVANYRTLSVLDKDGEVFTRVWCILELHLALIKVQEEKVKEKGGDDMNLDVDVDVDLEWNGLWVVYTAHEHTYVLKYGRLGKKVKAVGIVAGGAPCDDGRASDTAVRERPFPMDRIMKGLDATIQTANASKAHDKIHILNYISDNLKGADIDIDIDIDIDSTPPVEHENYEALNNAVRGAFASSIHVLQSACDGGDDEWQRVLTVMSKGGKKEMELHFGYGWNDLSAERAVEMINHLPPSIESLRIAYAPYGSPFMDAVIDWIEKSTNLKSFHILGTLVNGRNVDEGRDAGIKLAKILAAKNTIEYLWLTATDLMGSRNVDEWSKAFEKMTSLKKVFCKGMMYFIEYVDESTLDEKTSTVQVHGDRRQRIYWNDKTFPDATMTKEDVKKLKEATHATDIRIDGMVKVVWCGSFFDRCSKILN